MLSVRVKSAINVLADPVSPCETYLLMTHWCVRCSLSVWTNIVISNFTLWNPRQLQLQLADCVSTDSQLMWSEQCIDIRKFHAVAVHCLFLSEVT